MTVQLTQPRSEPAEEGQLSRAFFIAVRWCMVFVLSAMTGVALAIAPRSGLLSIPFALLCAGLTLWLAQGVPPEPSRFVTGLAGAGGLGLIVQLVVVLLLRP